MKAEQHLSDLNVSLGEARAFLQSNLNTPDLLMQILELYEFSNEMVAEIVGSSRGQVVSYFARNGIDSSVLDKFHSEDDETEDDDVEDDDSGYGSDAVELAVNSNLDADIGTEMESDLYEIELIAGSEYTFTVTSDALSSPYLILKDEEGTRIASDHQALDESEATFTFVASESGTFYLDLSDLDDDALGEYNISFSVADDFSDDTATTGLVEFDLEGAGSASGTLEAAGDSDWFGVTLTAGDYTLSFTSDAVESGELAIYDTDGLLVMELVSDEDGNFAFSSEAGGDYFIAASSSDEEETGTYLIGVTEQVEEVVV